MANLQAFERSEYQQVKADLHRKILDRLDLEKLGRTAGDSAREEVLILIRNSVNSEASVSQDAVNAIISSSIHSAPRPALVLSRMEVGAVTARPPEQR